MTKAIRHATDTSRNIRFTLDDRLEVVQREIDANVARIEMLSTAAQQSAAYAFGHPLLARVPSPTKDAATTLVPAPVRAVREFVDPFVSPADQRRAVRSRRPDSRRSNPVATVAGALGAGAAVLATVAVGATAGHLLDSVTALAGVSIGIPALVLMARESARLRVRSARRRAVLTLPAGDAAEAVARIITGIESLPEHVAADLRPLMVETRDAAASYARSPNPEAVGDLSARAEAVEAVVAAHRRLTALAAPERDQPGLRGARALATAMTEVVNEAQPDTE